MIKKRWRRSRNEKKEAWNQELTINKNLYREMSTSLQFHLHFMHSHFLFISVLHLERPPKRVFIYFEVATCCLAIYFIFMMSSVRWSEEEEGWGGIAVSWDANFTTTSQTRNGTHNVDCVRGNAEHMERNER